MYMKKLIILAALAVVSLPASAQSMYFPPNGSEEWDSITPESLGWCVEKIPALYTYLETTNTNAFIVLKDGKRVLEAYFNDFTPDQNHTWNSAGKCIMATLIGIAQQNGDLAITDKTSDYLGTGWTSMPQEKEDLITIKHQLTMTTSMDDSGDRWACTDDTCLHYLSDAGTRWAYHNAAYNLLRDVLESATGTTINLYMNQYLNNSIGMQGGWLKVGYFDLFVSQARSAARFGLLSLNKGVWNGTPVLDDPAYYAAMTTRSQELNKSYGYLWWLNGQPSYMLPADRTLYDGMLNPNAPPSIYSAMGKNGQIIDVWPEQNIVVVRMGGNPDVSNVPVDFHREMWAQLNQVMCNITSVNPVKELVFNLYPNPANNQISVEVASPIETIEILNTTGQRVLTANTKQVDISTLAKGIYFVKVTTLNGVSGIKKLVVY